MITNLMVSITINLLTNNVEAFHPTNYHLLRFPSAVTCPGGTNMCWRDVETFYRHTNQVVVVYPDGNPELEVIRIDKVIGTMVLHTVTNFVPISTNTVWFGGSPHPRYPASIKTWSIKSDGTLEENK